MNLWETDKLWIDQVESELYVDYLCYAKEDQLSKEMLYRLKNPDYADALYYLLLTVGEEEVEVSFKLRRRLLLLLELIETYFPHDSLFSDLIISYWRDALDQKQGVEETKKETRDKAQFLDCIKITERDVQERSYDEKRAREYDFFRFLYQTDLTEKNKDGSYAYADYILEPYLPSIIDDWYNRFPIIFKIDEMIEKIIFLLSSRSALTRGEKEDSIDFEVEVEEENFHHQYTKKEIKKVRSLDPTGFVDNLLDDIQALISSRDNSNIPQKNIMA